MAGAIVRLQYATARIKITSINRGIAIDSGRDEFQKWRRRLRWANGRRNCRRSGRQTWRADAGAARGQWAPRLHPAGGRPGDRKRTESLSRRGSWRRQLLSRFSLRAARPKNNPRMPRRVVPGDGRGRARQTYSVAPWNRFRTDLRQRRFHARAGLLSRQLRVLAGNTSRRRSLRP